MKFKNKTFLITGGTGSLGKALTKYILDNYSDIRKLIIFSRDEQKQFVMAQDYPRKKFPQIRFLLGDVRDLSRLKRAFQNVDYVIHAAAMKHVPLAEYNPNECIKTNIGGAQNVIEASLSTSVSKVVALSTDKACAPINLYGATKLTSDKLFIAANNITGNNPIIFSVVRYGNVMGSNGSVVNALENAWGGEIFIPKIPSYRILDIAEAVSPKCKIEIVGIRPGEKVHEEMITASDSFNTYDLGKYYVILPDNKEWSLQNYIKKNNAKSVIKGFSYNSGTNKQWETVKTLTNLIQKL